MSKVELVSSDQINASSAQLQLCSDVTKQHMHTLVGAHVFAPFLLGKVCGICVDL